MVNQVDTHYEKVSSLMNSGKDSIFEPCKIIDYYPDKLVVDVFCINSKQKREKVILLFPSLFLNAGIFSPPVKNSTGLLFWGPDKQSFLLPAQYMMPNFIVQKDGTMDVNASPNQVDKAFDLANVEPGEHVIRAMGGSYFYLKNAGDIEFGTPKLHKFSLNSKDGVLGIVVEAVEQKINSFQYYNGVYKPKDINGDKYNQNHHISIKSSDKILDVDDLIKVSDREMVKQILNDDIEIPVLPEEDYVWDLQMLNVFDGNDEKLKGTDGEELFLLSNLYKKDEIRCKLEVTKKGNIDLSTKGSVVINSAESISVTATEAIQLKTAGATLLIQPDGDIVWNNGKKTYTFNQIIERINALSAAHEISEL